MFLEGSVSVDPIMNATPDFTPAIVSPTTFKAGDLVPVVVKGQSVMAEYVKWNDKYGCAIVKYGGVKMYRYIHPKKALEAADNTIAILESTKPGDAGWETLPVEIAVKWSGATSQHIAQVYSSGLEFALISQNLEQCHPLVYCKDFLQDSISGLVNKKKSTIYSFTYDPATMPHPTLESTRIMLVNKSDPQFANKVAGALEFINHYARKMHLRLTTVHKVTNPKSRYASGAYVFDGSARWQNAPPLLSAYTLLLRVGFAHKVGTNPEQTFKDICSGKLKGYGAKDQQQLSEAAKGIEILFKVGYRKFFFIETAKNYPGSTCIDTMHNQFGICGFTQGKGIKYWHRKAAKDAITVATQIT